MSSTPLPTNIHPHARELISDSLSAEQTFTNINVWSDQNNQRLIRSQFNALSQSSPPPMGTYVHSLCCDAYVCSLAVPRRVQMFTFRCSRFEPLPDSNHSPPLFPPLLWGHPLPEARSQGDSLMSVLLVPSLRKQKVASLSGDKTGTMGPWDDLKSSRSL